MPNEKLEKLKNLLNLLDESLTRKEFTEAFENVIKLVLKIEQELIKKIDSKTDGTLENLKELQELHKEAIKKIDQENKSSFANWKKWALEQVNAIFIKSELKEKLNLFDEKISEIDNRLASVRDGAVGPPGEPGSPDTPEQVRDKLETLDGNDRLKIEAIKDLKEKLEELEKRPVRVGGGGGFSYIAYLQHKKDDETPTGTVNGVNTNFTLASIPNPTNSLKVYVNGQRMKLTEDYTVSGNTIVFLTAPPTGSILTCDYHT